MAWVNAAGVARTAARVASAAARASGSPTAATTARRAAGSSDAPPTNTSASSSSVRSASVAPPAVPGWHWRSTAAERAGRRGYRAVGTVAARVTRTAHALRRNDAHSSGAADDAGAGAGASAAKHLKTYKGHTYTAPRLHQHRTVRSLSRIATRVGARTRSRTGRSSEGSASYARAKAGSAASLRVSTIGACRSPAPPPGSAWLAANGCMGGRRPTCTRSVRTTRSASVHAPTTAACARIGACVYVSDRAIALPYTPRLARPHLLVSRRIGSPRRRQCASHRLKEKDAALPQQIQGAVHRVVAPICVPTPHVNQRQKETETEREKQADGPPWVTGGASVATSDVSISRTYTAASTRCAHPPTPTNPYTEARVCSVMQHGTP
jgi:hypothetical protein